MCSTLLIDETFPRWVSLSDRGHDFPAWVAICPTGTRSGILPSTSTGPSCRWTGACAPSPSRVRERFCWVATAEDVQHVSAYFVAHVRTVCCRIGLVSSPREQDFISCSRVKAVVISQNLELFHQRGTPVARCCCVSYESACDTTNYTIMFLILWFWLMAESRTGPQPEPDIGYTHTSRRTTEIIFYCRIFP